MADRKRLAEIASLPHLVALLRDVRDGKVARHRLGRTQSPVTGQDLRQMPGHGPGDLQKCATPLATLRRAGLIHLPNGEPTAETWPWTTTTDGADFLDHLDEQVRAEARQWLDNLDDEERAMAADIADREDH